MNYITELQRFIASHPTDWRELLEQKPYCLKIKEEDNLILFKYNQIDSDFSIPLVREARGIILEKSTWKIVCFPFSKFFNYSEPNCAKVDFDNSIFFEKIDGSLMKLFYYNNEWKLATNGTINAFTCDLSSNNLFSDPEIGTFGDLFLYVVRHSDYKQLARTLLYNTMELDIDITYLFEITSKYNKVVISYDTPDITHIGSRSNVTGEEFDIDIGVPHPEEFTFDTIEDVLEKAKTLDSQREGFVVCDDQCRRCKIKGTTYLQLHRLKGESEPNEKRLLELVRSNEGDEFLTYFEEYTEPYNRIKDLYEKFIEKVEQEVDFIFSMKYDDRKSFALIAKDMSCPSFLFMVCSHKISANEFRKFTQEMRVESLLNYIKEEE